MNETSPRHLRAETPPADHWQRWASASAREPAAAPAAPPSAPTPPPSLPTAAPPAATPPAAARITSVPAPGTPPSFAPDATAGHAIPVPAGGTEAPYRVLVVEDDRPQALFAQSVLHGAGMQAEVLGDAQSVLAAITQQRPDLILMDLHLPDLDGMRLTALIRQQPGMQLLPIVFLSGDPDPERQFDVLDSGADDYLSKPIRPRHLVAAVSNRIRRARAQAALATGHSAAQLVYNPETGLPTRQHVLAQLDAALARRGHGGLLFIELAGALGLRERHGHAAFERLMRQAAQYLAAIAQPHLLARLNDNSFLLLACGADETSLQAMAAALREQLAARALRVHEDASVTLRAVIGHAALSAGFTDAAEALEAAEHAALQARLLAAGVAGHTLQAESRAQQHLAMLEGQLELAYQPLMAVTGGGNTQYQVLLRLRRTDGSLLTASQVIPAAEAAGRITDLDQQVVEHALGLLDLYRHATPPLHLFVSQSPTSLVREGFTDWLLDALQQRGLDGSALVIDVCLPDALAHTAALQSVFQCLGSAGVRFCLSRFEPGKDANDLLTRLPLSFMRLAAGFASPADDPQSREALRTAIELAGNHRLQVICQQVEDPQAASRLRSRGIDFIQGNLVQSADSHLHFDVLAATP